VTGGPYYLPEVARPEPSRSGLEAPYWEAARREELAIQRCSACGVFQWGPEWICHRCHSFELTYEVVEPTGRIFSWERVWHPVHPALADTCPYVIVLVELPDAGGVRVLGNLLGEPTEEVRIGAPVEAVFEHHDGYTLVQWRRTAPEPSRTFDDGR
jgi:uncharacterized OB-fold protein